MDDNLFINQKQFEVCSLASIDDQTSIETSFKFRGGFYTSVNKKMPVENTGYVQDASIIIFAEKDTIFPIVCSESSNFVSVRTH